MAIADPDYDSVVGVVAARFSDAWNEAKAHTTVDAALAVDAIVENAEARRAMRRLLNRFANQDPSSGDAS